MKTEPTVKTGTAVKITHGNRAYQTGTLVRRIAKGTRNCVIIVDMDNGDGYRTFPTGYVQLARTAKKK